MAEAKTPEQALCKSCGFCCDGTLFSRAASFEGEKLFTKMETEQTDDGFWFKQPCPYFDKFCTKYDVERPNICSSYSCKILKKAKKKKISFLEAQKFVDEILAQKKRLASLIPQSQNFTTLNGAFEDFYKKNQELWDAREFRLQNQELLMEWALYQIRLKRFHNSEND